MSILSRSNSSSDSDTPFFYELRKQASFFLKDKIKTVRLALTDVTPVQLLTEEATDGNPLAPDTRTLDSISRAAFELDDYWRIVEVLHKRLAKFERKNWRVSYNTLTVLDHLLSHGPESAADEFKDVKDVISEMGSFQHIDEKGFNWGMNVRKKSERILQLLEKGPFLKEERDRARKLKRGIEGFGSYNQRSSSAAHDALSYGRSNSDFNHDNKEKQIVCLDPRKTKDIVGNQEIGDKKTNEYETTFKENRAPVTDDLGWNSTEESEPLILSVDDESKEEDVSTEYDHPFRGKENQGTSSLLSAREEYCKDVKAIHNIICDHLT